MLETYNETVSGNGYTLHNKKTRYVQDELLDSKAIKQQAKDEMTTTHNTVEYDTDTTSLVYMNAVANIANFKFIQALVANDTTLQPLYDAVYKSQVSWRGADNVTHTVQIESLAEAIEAAMTALATDVIKV